MMPVPASLIDSTLWIDFTRARSPRRLKEFIAPFILAPEAALAEPIMFEVLRHASDEEVKFVQAQFQMLPLLTTPENLWTAAAKLGQRCRRKGISAGSLDLLIASVALAHDAELVTFDQDFQGIAEASDLRLRLLQRPAA